MEKLIDLYDSFKDVFVKAIQNEIIAQGSKVKFEPPIFFKNIKDEDIFFVNILGISYVSELGCCSVHNKRTDSTGLTTEYWTPLGEMNFGKLRAIAKRL